MVLEALISQYLWDTLFMFLILANFLRNAMKEVFSSDVCYLAAADEGERELLTIFGKTFQSVDNVGLWGNSTTRDCEIN